ncbi:hypothetical protein HPB47_017854 [Ixodes persulcatus]|uniref:Uncharacterized protein n=1 Tax=Ixodes persulcatus TaxID=34615 RepID=A0AC60QM92_IXOPE|nr:hypothetical protein HPB47_017854 [Ixodes persulcatus]
MVRPREPKFLLDLHRYGNSLSQKYHISPLGPHQGSGALSPCGKSERVPRKGGPPRGRRAFIVLCASSDTSDKTLDRSWQDTAPRRSVATWTSQEGLEAPRAYFSGQRWAEQRRVPAAAQGAQVPLVFRGRTVRATDLAAGGAAAADNPGSRFCRECGVLFLHPIQLRSEAHRAGMGRLQAVRDPPPQPRRDAAALVVGSMAWDVAFADAIRAPLVRALGAGAAALPAAPPPAQEADVGGLLDDFWDHGRGGSVEIVIPQPSVASAREVARLTTVSDFLLSPFGVISVTNPRRKEIDVSLLDWPLRPRSCLTTSGQRISASVARLGYI